MQIHSTIESFRAQRTSCGRLALVATMGNLHQGHLSLVRYARTLADTVVATIFVNRLQFGPSEDFDRYPRTQQADCELLQAAGVAHVFAPPESQMYPQTQRYQVDVAPEEANILEGTFRPDHFKGVATVVLKLFNILTPDVAVFGKKDYQQLMIIRNMVEQLALPIDVVGLETVRAEDGLALSSRNGYLSAEQRLIAPQLHQQLLYLAQSVREGVQDWAALETKAVSNLTAGGWQPDYVSIRRRADLQQPHMGGDAEQPLVALAAAKLGTTRLIDNIEI